MVGNSLKHIDQVVIPDSSRPIVTGLKEPVLKKVMSLRSFPTCLRFVMTVPDINVLRPFPTQCELSLIGMSLVNILRDHSVIVIDVIALQ